MTVPTSPRKALHSVSCDWVPGGYAEAGQVYDLPDTQPNGDPLVWSEEFFELVEDKPKKKPAADETTEG